MREGSAVPVIGICSAENRYALKPDTLIFDKLLELLSGSGPGISFPGCPGELPGRSTDSLQDRSGEVSCSEEPSGPAQGTEPSSGPSASSSSTGSTSPVQGPAPSSGFSGSSSVAGMSAEEWKALLWEAHRQRVMGLVADAVAALPYDEQPPLAIRAKLALELEVIEKRNHAVNAAAGELLAIFEAAGLHPVIQKGPAVAALYPNPLHREPGDIDFYFPAEEFERSRLFVQGWSRDASPSVSRDAAFRGATPSDACGSDPAPASRGVAPADARGAGSDPASCGVAPADACGADPAPAFPGVVTTPVTTGVPAVFLPGSVTVPVMESDGAFWYKYKGVTVEHHPAFYDCRCQFPSIDVKSPEATLLMLSAHILKHALGKGIGLKQICDYFVARRSLNYDPVLLERLTAKAGLRKWQRLLDSFGPALRRIVATEGNFGSKPSFSFSSSSSSSSRYSAPSSPSVSTPSSSSGSSGAVQDSAFSSVTSAPGASMPPTSLQSSLPMSRMPVAPAMRLRTAAAFCSKIPFALRYSPREWLHTVLLLSKRSR